MYQGGPTHNAVFSGPHAGALWARPLDGRDNGGLAYLDGTIYVDTFGHRLYAIDARTGAVRWFAIADDVLMSTPVVKDGLVIVGGGTNRRLYTDQATDPRWGRPEGDAYFAYHTATGALAWAFKTVGEDMPSPAIAGETVVFDNGDGNAYGVDLRSGQKRWSFETLGIATMSAAAVANGTAYLSDCEWVPYDCETRAVDPRTGRTRWSAPAGGSDSSPAIAGGMVYVVQDHPASHELRGLGRNTLTALDARTGKVRWQYTGAIGPYSQAASDELQTAGTIAGGTIYQPFSNASQIVALDARSGHVRWSLRTYAPVKMSPVVTATRLYAGDVAGIFYTIDRRTGRILNAQAFKAPFSTSPPIIIGNTIYVMNGSTLYAFPLDK